MHLLVQRNLVLHGNWVCRSVGHVKISPGGWARECNCSFAINVSQCVRLSAAEFALSEPLSRSWDWRPLPGEWELRSRRQEISAQSVLRATLISWCSTRKFIENTHSLISVKPQIVYYTEQGLNIVTLICPPGLGSSVQSKQKETVVGLSVKKKARKVT